VAALIGAMPVGCSGGGSPSTAANGRCETTLLMLGSRAAYAQSDNPIQQFMGAGIESAM
jgi:hypothetical protein